MSAIALVSEMKNQPLVGYNPALAALAYADVAGITQATQDSTEVKVSFDQVKTLMEASMSAAPEQRSALLKEVVGLLASGYEQTVRQASQTRLAYACYAAVIAFLAGDVQSCKNWLYSAKQENDMLVKKVRDLIPEGSSYEAKKAHENTMQAGGVGLFVSSMLPLLGAGPAGALVIAGGSIILIFAGAAGTKSEDAKGTRSTEVWSAMRPMLEECERTNLVLEAAIEKF
jgi:hypothetical protein